jgi:hypothetical protein
MVAAFAYAFVYGQPRLVMTSWDYDRMGCGLNETTKDYPALYWPELPGQSTLDEVKAGNFTSTLKLLKSGVCVKECPVSDKSVPIDCHPTTWMNTTNAKKYNGCDYYPAGVSTGVTFRYATKQLGGFCLPDLGN